MLTRTQLHVFGLLLLERLVTVSADSYCSNSVITINGVGVESLSNFINNVALNYGANRSIAAGRDVDVIYQSTALDVGLSALGNASNITANGKQIFVNFIATPQTSATNSSTVAAASDYIFFPITIDGLLIVFNLPGIASLNLTTRNMAKMYTGYLNRWNDPLLQKDNPGVTLPNQPILQVARSDFAAATYLLTSALSTLNGTWNRTYGSFADPAIDNGVSKNWPPNVIDYFAKQAIGMAGVITSLPYSVGYLVKAEAVNYNLNYALLQNSKATFNLTPTSFLDASTENLRSAANYWINFYNGPNTTANAISVVFSLLSPQTPTGYPLATFQYVAFPRDALPSDPYCCVMEELVGFFYYMLRVTPASTVIGYSMANLNNAYEMQIVQTLLAPLTCNQENPLGVVLQSWQPPTPSTLLSWQIALIAIAIALVVGFFGGTFIYIQIAKLTSIDQWMVAAESLTEVALPVEHAENAKSKKKSMLLSSLLNGVVARRKENNEQVILFQITFLHSLTSISGATKYLAAKFRREIQHANVMVFYGFTAFPAAPHRIFAVIDYLNDRSTLHKFIRFVKYELNDTVKHSFALDIASGMHYLHAKNIVHGLLSCITCIVTANWNIKIVHWPAASILSSMGGGAEEMLPTENDIDVNVAEDEKRLASLLFMDPAAVQDLKEQRKRKHFKFSSNRIDVYSFGLLLCEIFTRAPPYKPEIDSGKTTFLQVLRAKFLQAPGSQRDKLLKLNFTFHPLHVSVLANSCVQPNLKSRPSFEEIAEKLRQKMSSQEGIVEGLMRSLETYVAKVEESAKKKQSVTDKLQVYMDELIPEKACQLKIANKEKPEAAYFENSTVVVVGIGNLNDLSLRYTAMQTVSFLNRLRNYYDRCIEADWKIKRVFSPGNSLIVFSESSAESTKEVVKFAKRLVTNIDELSSDEAQPVEEIDLRIGINTGPVVAGVIGTGLPRYCIFGTTVEIASLMQATAEKQKPLITESTTNILREKFQGEFLLEYRNEVHPKGQPSPIKTYWLL